MSATAKVSLFIIGCRSADGCYQARGAVRKVNWARVVTGWVLSTRGLLVTGCHWINSVAGTFQYSLDAGSPPARSSLDFEVLRRGLAAVAHQFKLYALAFIERSEPGPFD